MTCLGLLVFFVCSPQTATAADAPYCSIAQPIRFTATDTRETKEQADRENAKWKRLCGARP
ncbi:MAG: hypothetical protein DI527_16260 [Chelatococcus sp.]|nr:MAG: hypothetical protein DI527_16260 [Chelatococcus sp.]